MSWKQHAASSTFTIRRSGLGLTGLDSKLFLFGGVNANAGTFEQ
jgi:hypothetical protein